MIGKMRIISCLFPTSGAMLALWSVVRFNNQNNGSRGWLKK